MTSQPQPAPEEGRSALPFLRPLRDLAAWALVAAPAVLLFVAVVRLIPSTVGENFASRTQDSFYSFVNLATILFPLGAVLLALLIRPQHPKAKVITVIALVEYAVAAVFALIFGILVGLIQILGFSVRVAFEEFLIRVTWLAVFAVAAYAVFQVWRGLYNVPKPKPDPGMYGQPQYGAPGTYPGQPGYGPPPGYGQPGPGQPHPQQQPYGQGQADPQQGQPAYGYQGQADPQQGQPTYGHPGLGDPQQGQPAYGQTGQSESGHGQPTWNQPQPGQQPAWNQPAQSYGQPGHQPGYAAYPADAPQSGPPQSQPDWGQQPVSAQPSSPPGPYAPDPGHAPGPYSAPPEQNPGYPAYGEPTQAVPRTNRPAESDHTQVFGEDRPGYDPTDEDQHRR